MIAKQGIFFTEIHDMTQTPADTTAADGALGGMQIGIGAQYIKDFSFENPNAPHIFAPSNAQPDMTMGVNVHTRGLGGNTYEVLLALKVETKVEAKTAFIADLTYGGVFTVPAMPEDQLKMFLLVEAPRLLFPFARAILSNAMREGGFMPLMINPIDFMGLYMANKDSLGVVPAAGAA
jgi:preprotein translocase subunit SecB